MKTTLYGSTDKSNSNRAEYRQIFRDDAKYAGESFRKSKKKSFPYWKPAPLVVLFCYKNPLI